MPSLIYIARITRFSDELAEELRSSGFHVKAFGPGEITADDCLLVMTSAAVLASHHPTNSASAAATEPGAKGMPALTEMNAQLGSQADI
jgi:short-subunit dehydrogenase